MKSLSFVAACKDFFGFKPNQTLSEFMAEIKQLTVEDRADLTKEFKRVGYDITATPGV